MAKKLSKTAQRKLAAKRKAFVTKYAQILGIDSKNIVSSMMTTVSAAKVTVDNYINGHCNMSKEKLNLLLDSLGDKRKELEQEAKIFLTPASSRKTSKASAKKTSAKKTLSKKASGGNALRGFSCMGGAGGTTVITLPKGLTVDGVTEKDGVYTIKTS